MRALVATRLVGVSRGVSERALAHRCRNCCCQRREKLLTAIFRFRGHMTTISREKLYELVWAKTLGEVGAELGVSSFKVVEICAALNVPRPVNGHWSKLAAGKPVPIFPLPDSGPEGVESWTPGQSPRVVKRQPKRRVAKKQLPIPREPRVLLVHPLVRGAQDHFRNTRDTRDEGYLKPYKRCLVDVRVSAGCLGRGLSLANNLFNSLGAAGYPVAFAPYQGEFKHGNIETRESARRNQTHFYGLWSPDRPTVVKVGDIHFGLTIVETTEEVLFRYVGGRYIRESEFQATKLARIQPNHGWTTTRTLHTGRLKLVLYSPYRLVDWQKEWTETTPGSLEPQIKTVIGALAAHAADVGAKLAEARRLAEIERQKREAEREQWRRRDDARNVEKSRVDSLAQLKEVIADWAKAMATEQFFAGIERHLAAADGELDNQLEERLRLARSFIGTVDPVDFFRSWKAPAERYQPKYAENGGIE